MFLFKVELENQHGGPMLSSTWIVAESFGKAQELAEKHIREDWDTACYSELTVHGIERMIGHLLVQPSPPTVELVTEESPATTGAG